MGNKGNSLGRAYGRKSRAEVLTNRNCQDLLDNQNTRSKSVTSMDLETMPYPIFLCLLLWLLICVDEEAGLP